MNNGKHGQGTHITKMGAESLAENTPNDPKFICPICLPNLSAQAQKFWISMKKRLHWASVVHVLTNIWPRLTLYSSPWD